jgi:hypothetical protein
MCKGKKGALNDFIQISDKPCWENSFRELFVILGKRAVSMPSKMLGFKPFCLYLATWLLARGYIRDWIWFAVLAVVLFGVVGLKIITRWKNGEAAARRRAILPGERQGGGNEQ